MPPSSAEQLARAIDHTLLDPGAGKDTVRSLCREAAERRFAAVCVYPWWVPMARAELDGAAAVCTVVALHGLDSTRAKCGAARAAIAGGADEVDVVLAYAALRGGDAAAAGRDIAEVVAAARAERGDAVVRVIVEAGELTADQLAAACRLVAESGADFAKTSTGTRGGATVEAVSFMRRALPGEVAVKASGGIRTLAAAQALLAAGATRLGTSSGVGILDELEAHAVA
ncbi:MAG TPA: deoxyribose-phosphate aldolase [Gaiellales bacterium]